MVCLCGWIGHSKNVYNLLPADNSIKLENIMKVNPVPMKLSIGLEAVGSMLTSSGEGQTTVACPQLGPWVVTSKL